MTPVDRLRRVPPGRAGQIWLQHRLAVAERGAELLDEKLRILHGEAQRLALLTERTGAAWSAAHREAETWLLRAAVLVGERGLRLAAPPASTQVTLTWTHAMGATYPAEATLSFPTAPGTAVPAGVPRSSRLPGRTGGRRTRRSSTRSRRLPRRSSRRRRQRPVTGCGR